MAPRERDGAERSAKACDARRPPPLVAARGADAARRRAALFNARSAELLVRRGIHARPRAAREPRRDAPRHRQDREHAAALVRAGLGLVANLRHGRGRVALPLGARRRCHRAGCLGDRSGARRAGDRLAPRGDRLRRARRREPAVRVVFPGSPGRTVFTSSSRHSRSSTSCAPIAHQRAGISSDSRSPRRSPWRPSTSRPSC